MRILYIGDIVGSVGMDAVRKYLPKVKEDLKLDFIVANAQNSNAGYGATPQICEELHNLGIDVITMGYHVTTSEELTPYLNKDKRIVRPMNLPKFRPGSGHTVITLPNGKKVAVVQFIGQYMFMETYFCPFRDLRRFFASFALGRDADVIIVDVHAAYTGEKTALGRIADGKCSAVLGTYSHVPTNDYYIQRNGTAYQSDVGMTGDYDGILGFQDPYVLRFMEGKLTTPGQPVCEQAASTSFCATFFEVGSDGLATRIEPVILGGWLRENMPEL